MMSGDASKTGSVMKSSQQGEAESSGKASTLQDSGKHDQTPLHALHFVHTSRKQATMKFGNKSTASR